jgi:hypothetical protein
MSPAESRLSKSSLFSLICGILLCIPILSGLLAMLLGLIGFIRAGAPGVRGRWMAVVGGLLGLFNLMAWSVAFLFFGGVIAAAIGMTQAPRVATHDFIRDLTAGDVASAKAHNPGFDDAAIDRLATYCKAQGTFVDTTFTNSSINNSTAHLEGTVQFSTGTQQVTADLELVDDKWQVVKISIKP